MSCSLHKLCFEWSITKIERVVFMFWRFSPFHMGKSSRSVRTRSRIVAKPYQFLYERPFPDDWKSPDTSRKADAVSANLFQVLIAIKQTPVFSICRVSLSLSLSLTLTHSLTVLVPDKKKTCLPNACRCSRVRVRRVAVPKNIQPARTKCS